MFWSLTVPPDTPSDTPRLQARRKHTAGTHFPWYSVAGPCFSFATTQDAAGNNGIGSPWGRSPWLAFYLPESHGHRSQMGQLQGVSCFPTQNTFSKDAAQMYWTKPHQSEGESNSGGGFVWVFIGDLWSLSSCLVGTEPSQVPFSSFPRQPQKDGSLFLV